MWTCPTRRWGPAIGGGRPRIDRIYPHDQRHGAVTCGYRPRGFGQTNRGPAVGRPVGLLVVRFVDGARAQTVRLASQSLGRNTRTAATRPTRHPRTAHLRTPPHTGRPWGSWEGEGRVAKASRTQRGALHPWLTDEQNASTLVAAGRPASEQTYVWTGERIDDGEEDALGASLARRAQELRSASRTKNGSLTCPGPRFKSRRRRLSLTT